MRSQVKTCTSFRFRSKSGSVILLQSSIALILPYARFCRGKSASRAHCFALNRGGNLAIVETGAGVAFKVLETAHKQGWLDKIIDAFKRKHRVLVLGSTGVGKTNFLQSLTSLTAPAIDYMKRTEFSREHGIKIGKSPFIFIDTPGELGKQPRRKKAIREALSGEISGVINVVSYGYHEYRSSHLDKLNRDGSPSSQYLSEHRKVEVAALSEWVELLGDQQTIDWAMTIVSKADLWWDRKDEVLQFYTSGGYSRSLGSISKMAPSVIEYCSVFHKFYGRGPLSGVFDERDRENARERLLHALLEAVGKSKLNG